MSDTAIVTTLEIERIKEATGMDVRTIRKRLQQLPDEPTFYDVLRVLRTPPETEQARGKKLTAEAELKRIQLAEEKGKLLRKVQVQKELTIIFKALHNQCFVLQPRRLSGKLVGKTEPEIRRILQQDNGEIFDKIRADYRDFCGGALVGDSATVFESKRLGQPVSNPLV